MHMRFKKWARPELEACPYYLEHPETLPGKWDTVFPKKQPLHVELGCGKGVSTAQMVFDNRDTNYVAVDIATNVLGYTRRNIEQAYGDSPVDNVRIACFDVANIGHFFAPEDNVERIIISFCNPWGEKKRHEKRRLTHPRMLLLYRDFLRDGGEIWFKTDDDGLFDDSVRYFQESGFNIRYLTRDLHADGFTPNYVSEHEAKFTQLGVPTKFLIAVKNP